MAGLNWYGALGVDGLCMATWGGANGVDEVVLAMMGYLWFCWSTNKKFKNRISSEY